MSVDSGQTDRRTRTQTHVNPGSCQTGPNRKWPELGTTVQTAADVGIDKEPPSRRNRLLCYSDGRGNQRKNLGPQSSSRLWANRFGAVFRHAAISACRTEASPAAASSTRV